MNTDNGDLLGNFPLDSDGKDPLLNVIKSVTGGLLIPLVLMLYSSPIPVLWTIYKRGSTMGYNFLPYMLLWMNCFSWVVFTVHRGVATMYEPFIVNAYGLCVNTLSLIIYRTHILDIGVRSNFLKQVPVVIVSMMVLGSLSFVDTIHTCSDPNSLQCWWGKMCVLVNIALFAGPFAIFRRVWHTKSVEFMPLGPAVIGLIASIDCTLYFYCLQDSNGLFPNACGICLSFSQIVFYFFIRCKHPQTMTEVSSRTLIRSGISDYLIDAVEQSFQGSFKYEDPRETVAAIVEIVRTRAGSRLSKSPTRGSLQSEDSELPHTNSCIRI